MLEKALKGGRGYWTWIAALVVVIGVGLMFYVRQLNEGLTITGLSRDVSWGFYIAQFTFLVGVAASAVMVVLPYYLHNFKKFSKMTVLGEFLAVSSVIMCLLFIIVDMGQPMRILNVMLYPTPHSMMFWDMIVCMGYLMLNLFIATVVTDAEYKGIAPPKWIKPIIYLSIPWAFSIHTVTAFLYCGLAARPFWLTAILTPRFLATAFAAGPALLLLICFLLRRTTKFDAGDEAIRKLGVIIAYAMTANLFFLALEVFTAVYSNMPHHTVHLQYLYLGIDGHDALVPWMWSSAILGLLSLVLLLVPKLRNNLSILPWACGLVFVSIWIDKGMGMIVGGFVPAPSGRVTEYMPTFPEIMITLAVYALGFLILTILYRAVLAMRKHV